MRLLLLLGSLSVWAAQIPNNTTFTSQPHHTLAHDTRQLEWAMKAAYERQTFFDKDPNHGMVQYVTPEVAFRDGLAFWTENGTPGIQAEHWKNLPVGEKRNSVRISSKTAFGGGLFVFDMALLPHGCGVWPAVWMLGAGNNWPYSGEIDVIVSVDWEGVHNSTQNQMTIHASTGCTISGDTDTYSGVRLNENCDSSKGSIGCSIRSDSDLSYGDRFNNAGGGVYALLWDSTGIKFWNFQRASIPQDLVAREPQPHIWGKPVAVFDRGSCDPYSFFDAQVIILNVNLCGDWAGNTYDSSGCPGTCAERISDPANLDNTIMLINSIVVYQQTDGRSSTKSADEFDSGFGAAGPINPTHHRGHATRSGVSFWLAFAATVLGVINL
ncbi:hypothetical protein CspeluHIS016_0502220 [Cutaneotrichosporon spelunceum]|uniref:GH16 domain-containing protein n=1 Tax=Cutaneotrichosporon spelunceum TaxID=1672016 RepID=A0AAD3YCJ9_9TREE|nr:hypothetical protein CspeluHIS016_0502220 [Cutaneotrichosporon spelunceum]